MNTAYEQLPLSARADIETAFITLGGVPAAFGTSALSLPGRTASSPQQRLAALQSKVITEVALPHVCRIMNLCLTEVALLHVCRDFGTPTGSSSSAGGGGGDLAPSSSVKQSKQSGASLPPQQQGDAAAAAGGPVVLPPTEFTFPAMIQLYNALAPLQPAFTEQYLQFLTSWMFTMKEPSRRQISSTACVRQAIGYRRKSFVIYSSRWICCTRRG